MENLTKELYESPQKEINKEKFGDTGDECICCGKPMKSGVVEWVHMNENWVAVSPIVTEQNCEELTGFKSQGCFPIGSECAKKMKGFTTKGEFKSSRSILI